MAVNRNFRRFLQMETLEGRVLMAAVPIDAYRGYSLYSVVMGPVDPSQAVVTASQVGKASTAPGHNKTTPVIPPPPLPAPPVILQLAEPSDIGQKYYFGSGYSLWGFGPTPMQGKQVYLSNCWFIAGLKSEAAANPGKLTESAGDDPAGGWDVKLLVGGAMQWVHVTDGFPWFCAQPTDGALWMPIFEKGWAEVNGSYAVSAGPNWMSTEIQAVGWQTTTVGVPSSDAAFINLINAANTSGIGLTVGTNPQTTYLVSSHAYTILGYTIDTSTGVTTYQMLNPWMFDGNGNLPDSNPNDGIVSITRSQLLSDIYPGIVEAIS